MSSTGKNQVGRSTENIFYECYQTFSQKKKILNEKKRTPWMSVVSGQRKLIVKDSLTKNQSEIIII